MKSTCKFSWIITAIAIALTASVKPCASEAATDYSSAYVLPGLYVSYNMREGYRKLDDAYMRLDMDNSFMVGFTLGKRFALNNPRWRIQAAIEGGWGIAEDMEFFYLRDGYDGPEYWIYYFHNYFTGGILADLHFLFPTATRTYFLSAGPGFHLTYLWPRIKQTSPSVSANIGAGVEYRIFKKIGMSVAYNLRLWQPVSYINTGEIFPMGVNQKEFHITHTLQAQMLLPSLRLFK
jgi:hypothetical protein